MCHCHVSRQHDRADNNVMAAYVGRLPVSKDTTAGELYTYLVDEGLTVCWKLKPQNGREFATSEKVYKIRITDLDELKQRLENGVGQAGSCRHCGSHSSVASSIAPDR